MGRGEKGENKCLLFEKGEARILPWRKSGGSLSKGREQKKDPQQLGANTLQERLFLTEETADNNFDSHGDPRGGVFFGRRGSFSYFKFVGRNNRWRGDEGGGWEERERERPSNLCSKRKERKKGERFAIARAIGGIRKAITCAGKGKEDGPNIGKKKRKGKKVILSFPWKMVDWKSGKREKKKKGKLVLLRPLSGGGKGKGEEGNSTKHVPRNQVIRKWGKQKKRACLFAKKGRKISPFGRERGIGPVATGAGEERGGKRPYPHGKENG